MPHKCTGCGRQFADGSKEMLSGCPDCGGSKFQFMPAGGAPAAEEPPEPPQREAGAVAETVGAATTKLRDFVGDDPPARSESPTDGGAAEAASGGRSSETAGSPDPAGAAESPDPPGTTGVEAAADAVTDPDDIADGVGSIDAREGSEDGAQSSARSEMVSPDELPDGPPSAGAATTPESSGRGAGSPAGGAAGRNAELPDRVGDDDGDARVVDTPAEERPDLSELREELNDQFEGIRICERGQYELNLMELYEREETIIALQENGRYVIEPPESWHGED